VQDKRIAAQALELVFATAPPKKQKKNINKISKASQAQNIFEMHRRTTRCFYVRRSNEILLFEKLRFWSTRFLIQQQVSDTLFHGPGS